MKTKNTRNSVSLDYYWGLVFLGAFFLLNFYLANKYEVDTLPRQISLFCLVGSLLCSFQIILIKYQTGWNLVVGYISLFITTVIALFIIGSAVYQTYYQYAEKTDAEIGFPQVVSLLLSLFVARLLFHHWCLILELRKEEA
ncbi:MAG: hypothetical protein GY829_12960 [Gammaproteobacteria bacterium]|nr:hypothetical protein [Gammaproteobacteria bacterium]